MTHLEIENLASDYLEGRLEPSPRAAMEAHLSECAPCRELLGDVRHALELCRTAEDVEPKPWLVSRIMQATVGARQPTWGERIAAYLRPVLQPRVAYPIAMTVFTFSMLVNFAGVNLRSLRIADLNPRTWVGRANRQGHMLAARAEKFYYDLRVVYEIESHLRLLGGQPQNQEEESPKPAAPSGGSSQGAPSDQTVASRGGAWAVVAAESDPALPPAGNPAGLSGAGRSLIP
jgi:hypothetical protein